MVRCPKCGRSVGVDAFGEKLMFAWHDSDESKEHFAYCSMSGESVTRAVLGAFGEAIATVARARLVARAMEGLDVTVSVDGADFRANWWFGSWCIARYVGGIFEEIASPWGTPEDTAAEVVDTLLRLAAEWSER
jgi:hypothetical protein